MGLNPQQKKAAEYLDGPLLVIAGPGTGKTQLLSEKVAYILKNTDTSPENILCLTFTETGALNMRERLKSIVGTDAMKVNIGTYHAFGSDILSQYKNYSDSYDRKLDSAIDEVVQFKIIKDIQDHLPGSDILRGDAIRDILDTISKAKAANLTASELSQIADQNLADSKAISDFANIFLKNIVPRQFAASLVNAYQPLYDNLKQYAEIEPILKNIDRSIKSLVCDLKNALDEATATERIKPLSAWKDSYFEKDDRGNYRLKDRIANKKLKSLANVMQKYDDYLKSNGLYDFDDMIGEAIKALQNDQGFRLTMSERYQFILLDEFQDTNPSQFEIIKQITDYEKPIIMAVGDDDQAIYEFQGASATSLSNFQKHYNAETVTLVENYRSTQEILDYSTTIIRQVDDGSRFGDKELHANKEASSATQIERHEFLSSDTEYFYVADTISKLIKNGVKQTDIAIIAPKHKYILPLLPFMKAHNNINIAYEKRDNLLEDEKIHEILTISKLIYELAHEKQPHTSLLEILSYPFWNVSMLEVIKAVNRAHDNKKATLDYLADSASEDLQQIANFFANLVAKSYDTPLEIFLDYLIGATKLNDFKSPFLEYYTKDSEYSTFELYENLATLRGKLNKYFDGKNPKLDNLIEMISDYEAATMPITSSSPYRDSEDAVQILSAHKAKGLEFEYVFLIAADHSAWGKGKGNNNLLALPKNLAQIRHTGTTDGERIRLLYVAMTRAKKHLIITNSVKDFDEKSPERLEYLGEYVEKQPDGTEKILVPNLPAGELNCHYQESAETKVKSVQTWLSRYLTDSPDMRAIYKDRLKNYKMSASSLTSFVDVIYGGPQDFFNHTILRAPDEPATEQIIFGNLIHATFEHVTNTGANDEEAINFFLSELSKVSAEPEIIARIRDKGPADLAISLKAFGQILRAGKAEVNLAPDKISINGVPLTGKLDHIIIDDATKTIEIYDFKTGNYHADKWTSHPTLYKYMLQLEFYKLLLNLSPTYSKYKVEKAHILFVTPDKDGEVHDRVYEFNNTDESELLNLIEAVYWQINTLSFLDDAELFIPADNRKTIKDVQKFISTVIDKMPQK